MVTTFDSNGDQTPWGLSRLPQNEVKQLGVKSPTLVRADLLWQSGRWWGEGQNLELARTKPNMIGQVTDCAESIKSPTNAETRLTRRTEQKGNGIELPTNFHNITPMARTFALAQSSAPDILITEFCDLRAQTNIVRAVQGCLTSVSSGVNCCLRFCDALGTPAFPITHATVRRRGATFTQVKHTASTPNTSGRPTLR